MKDNERLKAGEETTEAVREYESTELSEGDLEKVAGGEVAGVDIPTGNVY